MISCYSSLDGTALRQCKEFGSHYTWILFYATIAAAIGPLLAGATIKDAPEGSGGNLLVLLFERLEKDIFVSEENDYKIAFYLYDGCLFLALLISLKLKVTLGSGGDEGENEIDLKKKRKKETREALKQIFSKPALIFFGLLFNNGLLWGVVDAYVLVYLQEYLGASSEMIGNH